MEIKSFKVRLKGLQPILGSVALDKEIFTNYIATKVKTEDEGSKALKDVDNVVDRNAKVTGFYRDDVTGTPILKGYQVKGFFKESAKALKDQLKLASCVSKVDNFIFIQEVNIPIMRGGITIMEPDGYLERPLRGETAQGPRVSLAKSEIINNDWYVEFTIRVVENKGTAKSVPITVELVKELLKYGSLKGLCQWRNAGYGSFDVEFLD